MSPAVRSMPSHQSHQLIERSRTMNHRTRIAGAAIVALGLTLTSVGTAAVSTAASSPTIHHRALTPTQEQCLTDALTGLLAARADARAVRRAARADARAAYRSSLAQAAAVRDEALAAASNRGARIAALRAYETTADSLRRTSRQARRAADRAMNASYREARAVYRQDRQVCLDPPPTS